MLKSHQTTIEILTKANTNVLKDSTKAIQAPEKTISETIKKVEKLHDAMTKFMTEFKKLF